MILKYGAYAHALGEATIVISTSALATPRGGKIGQRERWEIAGFLQAATQADLTRAIDALKAAYAIDGQELAIYLPDGVTRTSHVLGASRARVVSGPSFPEGRGAEYSTYRSYQIVIEADMPTWAAGAAPLVWEESLSFSGGGARFVYLTTLAGPPQRQRVAQATTFRVTQAGRAIGEVAYPAPSGPLWPAAEHIDQRRIERHSPRQPRAGGGWTEYEIAWHYAFESAWPLAGEPIAK